MKTLLTKGNPKTMKGEKKGYLTFVLHLAPANLSGYNVCPMATQGCTAACLNTAGRGGIFKPGETTNKIQEARKRRTRLFFEDRQAFMRALYRDITRAIKYATKRDLIPVFRLNGTSDIRWETVREPSSGKNIMELFPHIQFYDYTKIKNRRGLPANYHLTFSLAESNEEDAVDAMRAGMNVAAVFRNQDTVARVVRDGFLGANAVDGDESDLRFLDKSPNARRYWQGNQLGVIVALYAKGKAKKDASGFVRD